MLLLYWVTQVCRSIKTFAAVKGEGVRNEHAFLAGSGAAGCEGGAECARGTILRHPISYADRGGQEG